MAQERPRQRTKRKKSFTDALKQKYCVDESSENMSGFVIEIAFHGKPKTSGSDAELAYLRNVILNNSGVWKAGLPHEGLKSLCPNVVDLDLSDNYLHDWSDVLELLTQLPCLKFVNIARNPLKDECSALEKWSTTLPSIENLVLNGTMVSWSDILNLSKNLPSLKELHVCANDFDKVTCNNTDVAQNLPNLHCLRMNNNRIQSWEEIWKLRHLPQLQSLILSENPLQNLSYEHKDDDVTDLCVCDQNKDMNGNVEIQNEIQNIVNNLVHDTFRSVATEEMQMGSFEDTLYVPEEEENVITSHDTETLPDSENDSHMGEMEHDKGDNSECEIFDMSIDESSDSHGIVCSRCGKFKKDILGTKPFSNLSSLCLSQTKLGDWKYIEALSRFPSLKSVRVMDIDLTTKLSQDDRRKLQIASLPNISILNGSEVTVNERDKAEWHYLRFFMDNPSKPPRYFELEKKHGKPKPLRNVMICPRGFQEWINLTLVYKDQMITSRVRVVEPVGKLRLFVAKKFCLYASVKNFKMFHLACGPYHDDENKVFEELSSRCENLPMSRFDIMEGDQVHIDLDEDDDFTKEKGFLHYLMLGSYVDKGDEGKTPIQNTPPKNIAFVVK
ncbi:uncharacterized protein LOC127723596 [Mytilus californianus]|uniref:uncharacterized protein LOC127723596 n=1 Tax=Mytilus californianus TaxID=6549 RepID=UPI00224625CD|nr:uncharacterized protein LOC127723596 [Mytilus californianus]